MVPPLRTIRHLPLPHHPNLLQLKLATSGPVYPDEDDVGYASNYPVFVSWEGDNWQTVLIAFCSRFSHIRALNINTRPTQQAHDTERGSIGVLPVELLLEVIEQLDRKALSTCLQVCRRWYGIASPYFFAVVPVRHSHRQSFVRHCRAHPELAAYTKNLHLFDRSWGELGDQPHVEIRPRPFDVQLLASALPSLTNLDRVYIVGYDNKTDLPLPFRRMARRQRTPVALPQLTLMCCENATFILLELLRLFSVDTLVCHASLSVPCKRPEDTTTLFPHASFAVKHLVLRESDLHFHNFFEQVLAAGCLRSLATGGWWMRHDISNTIDRVLRSPAAQNLLSISMGGVEADSSAVPVARPPSIGDVLGAALSRCTRLQCVSIGLVHRSFFEEDPFESSCAVLSPVLANLAPTLRALAFHVWVLVFPSPRRRWRWASATESLAPVDRLLDPAGAGRRFRDLRRVEMYVHYWHTENTVRDPLEAREREEVALAATPLPRLRAAGLLCEFQVDDVQYGPECCGGCLLRVALCGTGVRELTAISF